MKHAIVDDIWRKHAEKGASGPSTFVGSYPYDTIDDSSILHHFASYLTHLSFIYLRQLGFWLLSRSCHSFSAHKNQCCCNCRRDLHMSHHCHVPLAENSFDLYAFLQHMRHAIVEGIWRRHAQLGTPQPYTFVECYPSDCIDDSSIMHHISLRFPTIVEGICIRAIMLQI